MTIPYCLPHFTSQEIDAVNDILHNPEKMLTEFYTKACRQFFKQHFEFEALLTHSCTAALEMSALLLNIQPGDEVIVPSYTFVSTANAFALFGAKLVFVDIDKQTLNLDANQLDSLISAKTKAIVVMHYAGIACDMDRISAIASHYGIPVIEDAAQCIGSSYKNKWLGTLGTLGTLSFHSTKNITSGLGGALIINDYTLAARAKIIWQKGTNREAFLEGQVDKYTWQDLGSSYMMNELGAALLFAQLQRVDKINTHRLSVWMEYHKEFKQLAENFDFQRPLLPTGCIPNGHIYYLIAPNDKIAANLRTFLANQGVNAPSHYVPLHLSPAGKRFAKNSQQLPVCEQLYRRIIRLPIWEGMEKHCQFIIDKVFEGVTKSIG